VKVLIVEDEAELGTLLQSLLKREKFTTDLAPDLEWAKEALLSQDFDLVLLDRRLPDGDGKDLVEFCKLKGISTRFLFLTALGDLEHKIEGLELGGDDYLTKPFEPEELIARIHALLRRNFDLSEVDWRAGRIVYYPKSRSVMINGESVVLTRRELIIFEQLIRSAGRVVTRDAIEAAAYGFDDDIRSNTMESHISRIRKLLEKHNAGASIRAIRGVGYTLREDA